MPGDIDEKLAAVDDSLSAASGDEVSADGADDGDGGSAAWDGGDGGSAAWDGGDGGSTAWEGGGALDEAGGGSLDGGESVAADVAALTDRVAELEAAVQALRGYAGSVRAVNDRVEERADAAVATAESLRERVAALEAEERSSGGRRDRAPGRRGDAVRGRREGGRDPRDEGDRGVESDRGVEGVGAETGSQEPRGRVDDAVGRPRSTDDEPVSWPPTEPREPYGEVDADDDRERPGLVARLRDAL